MSSILKKISGFFYIPAKEFNRIKFRYASDETETEYTLKGSFFGIPIYMTVSEDSMNSIIDFCNNKNTNYRQNCQEKQQVIQYSAKYREFFNRI